MRPNKFYNDLDTSESIKWLIETTEKNSSESYIKSEIARCDGRESIRVFCYTSSVELSLSLLKSLYVRGDSIESMRSAYILTRERLHLLNNSIQTLGLFDEMTHLHGLNNLGMLVALGTALGESRDAIGSDTRYAITAGYDLFVDRLLNIYDPERPLAPELHNKSVYGKLYEVFDAPPDKRPGMIARYLDTWEKLLLADKIPGILYPVPEHLLKEWKGFWCYPAAAMVAALNIDDSSFIDHEFYPTDLMKACAQYRGEPVILPPVKAGPLPEPPKPAPRRKKAPALLAPWEAVFNAIVAVLPKGLQNLLWNGLIQYLVDECELDTLDAIDFIYALSDAQWKVDLLTEYRRMVLLHVDWKDAESALSGCDDLARTVGIKEDFDPDITTMNGVEEVLTVFSQWLQAHGYHLLSPDTGDDAYYALITQAKGADQFMAQLTQAGIKLQRFD